MAFWRFIQNQGCTGRVGWSEHIKADLGACLMSAYVWGWCSCSLWRARVIKQQRICGLQTWRGHSPLKHDKWEFDQNVSVSKKQNTVGPLSVKSQYSSNTERGQRTVISFARQASRNKPHIAFCFFIFFLSVSWTKVITSVHTQTPSTSPEAGSLDRPVRTSH